AAGPAGRRRQAVRAEGVRGGLGGQPGLVRHRQRRRGLRRVAGRADLPARRGLSVADLLHITTPAEWEAARATGEVAPPSLATEGVVHCSTRDQLPTTLA